MTSFVQNVTKNLPLLYHMSKKTVLFSTTCHNKLSSHVPTVITNCPLLYHMSQQTLLYCTTCHNKLSSHIPHVTTNCPLMYYTSQQTDLSCKTWTNSVILSFSTSTARFITCISVLWNRRNVASCSPVSSVTDLLLNKKQKTNIIIHLISRSHDN